jgi:amidase
MCLSSVRRAARIRVSLSPLMSASCNNDAVQKANVDMAALASWASELCYATATELARRIRDRETSSAELTEAFLARIAAHNGKLNAIVQLFEADARSRANDADEALARGQIWGPLHGVPVTIKEQFLMANTPSTLNSKRLKDFVAPEDGVLVKRIRAAGAVILGKTNVPANLQGYQCKGDVYPEGKNPYRLERSPGGSSGGGAAAVAAGMTALELGADGGGSLRVPAHFCGVYCLKPTDKTIPRYGGLPFPEGARGFLVNMGQPGPLGRSIDDLELLWRIIRGPDPSDFEIAPIAWRPVSGRSLDQLCFAWTDGFEQFIAGAETREQLAALAARIEPAGARVEKAAPAIHPRASEVFVQLQGAMLGQDMPWLVRKIFPMFVARGLLKGQPHMVRLLRRALKMNTQEYAAALGVKRMWVEEIERFFRNYDVLLAPVSYGPAFTRCKEGSALDFDGAMRPYNDYCWPFVGPFNASGHPALVMPLGTSKDGLPIGVQLIGPFWSEPELLHIARQLAALTNGFDPPKGI